MDHAPDNPILEVGRCLLFQAAERRSHALLGDFSNRIGISTPERRK